MREKDSHSAEENYDFLEIVFPVYGRTNGSVVVDKKYRSTNLALARHVGALSSVVTDIASPSPSIK